MLPLRFWTVLLAWGVSNYARQTTGRVSLHHSESEGCTVSCASACLFTLTHTTHTKLLECILCVQAGTVTTLKTVSDQADVLMDLPPFLCHPPFSSHSVSICVSSGPPPVRVLLDLSIMKIYFSVSFFSTLCPLFSPLHLSSQPFMSPRYPGGPRPSLRMPNQVLNSFISVFLLLSFPLYSWWT